MEGMKELRKKEVRERRGRNVLGENRGRGGRRGKHGRTRLCE